MSRLWIGLGIFAVIVLTPILIIWGTYNGLVSLDIQCDQKWAQVQVQYQRRYDLIPRIVNATKLYLNYEKSLLTEITEARSAWTEAFKSNNIEKQMIVGETLGDLVNRLMVIVTSEAYPELKGNQVVLSLIDELEGTENRIAVERMRYNEAIAEYNKALRTFPSGIIANMFGFEKRLMFEIELGVQKPPLVPIG